MCASQALREINVQDQRYSSIFPSEGGKTALAAEGGSDWLSCFHVHNSVYFMQQFHCENGIGQELQCSERAKAQAAFGSCVVPPALTIKALRFVKRAPNWQYVCLAMALFQVSTSW